MDDRATYVDRGAVMGERIFDRAYRTANTRAKAPWSD
jgi:hypothetical protein